MRSFLNSLSLITVAGAAALLSLPACSSEDAPDPNGPGLATGGSGSGGAGTTNGIPLLFTDGWLDDESNTLGAQGAVFAYSDPYTAEMMTENIETAGQMACISGTAAKVDMSCTPMPPAVDCYGEYWGAAIGMNLNQPVDETTMMGADPMPFDLSSIGAISFELTGSTIPTSLRFVLETVEGDRCTHYTEVLDQGVNTIQIADLEAECWQGGSNTPITDWSQTLKIAWQVVTGTATATPFDYCVSNVQAIPL